jgi:membrane protein YdbS with pleckstrin-like domain
MIYEAIKGLLLYLLQAPGQPPDPPAGSPGSVRVFRAAPQFLYYKLVVVGLVFIVFTLMPGIVMLFLAFNPVMPAVAKVIVAAVTACFLLGGVAAYFTTRLEYDMRYYLITDRSLRIREGVWTIQEVTLTYANVQHLEIRQGPIQQLLGISDLVVRTAGGAVVVVNQQQQGGPLGHQGILMGIDNAEEIRDLINGHLKHYRHAGLGDPEERRGARARGADQWSPAAMERLHEIRDELRSWRLGTTSAAITRKDV